MRAEIVPAPAWCELHWTCGLGADTPTPLEHAQVRQRLAFNEHRNTIEDRLAQCERLETAFRDGGDCFSPVHQHFALKRRVLRASLYRKQLAGAHLFIGATRLRCDRAGIRSHECRRKFDLFNDKATGSQSIPESLLCAIRYIVGHRCINNLMSYASHHSICRSLIWTENLSVIFTVNH